ncbi:MAG: hypothetical protein NZ869_10025, partial [Thermoanaerobaculum sp.]|nr:hypothetical protein [Thermoanaerobaculum sp.]
MSKWERWALFAWQTALGLVFLAALTMLLWQSRNAPLSVDEGYNLEVVDNLARNGLYASYGNRRLDANWSLPKFFDLQPSNIFKPWLFDPRITTGPVVLLPLALNWALFPGSFLALHAVMVAFFLLGLWATWHLTPEGSGRLLGFFGASALFSTLWFNFRPNAIIGEIPAISLVLWAMVALTGERFFLAGLALGAAIQSKFILLLPTLFGLSLVGFRLIRQGTWQKIAALFAGLTLPTLAFELYRLASLGSLVAWWDSWREFRAFAQEQARAFATESLNKKWFSLSTQGPGEFSVAALLAALGLGHLLQKNLGYKETENDLRVKDALSVGFAIGLSTITLWLCFSNQSSYRQVLPGTFLVFIPLML